jgi:hypothetical protein
MINIEMFTSRVCPCQKSPKNENGWVGKVKTISLLKESMGYFCILSIMDQTFVYLNMTMTRFYCNLSSYGEIIEHKCPIS